MGSDLQRLLASTTLLCASLLAQNVTVPATLAGVEGGGGTNIPFGSNQACRYQAIYEVEELPWTGPRVITGISLRADFQPGVAIAAKGFLDISVLMSTTHKKAAEASAIFSDNYGTDATWVLQHQVMQLPAQPVLPAGPRAANITFTFAVPWAYGLTPVIQGQPVPTSLLVEIWIHTQPSGAYRLDNLSSCVAPTGTFGNRGPACTVPGKPPIDLTADATMLAGSSYAWRIANAEASMPYFMMLGPTNTGFMFGLPTLPLPYPMFDPANPTQPSVGLAFLGQPAPDCWFNISPLVWLTGTCDTTGAGVVTTTIPAGRDTVGVTYYAQALVLSPTANPLRMITSLGRYTTVCGPLGVARIFSFYDGAAQPPQPVPTSGSVQYGVGPILDVH